MSAFRYPSSLGSVVKLLIYLIVSDSTCIALQIRASESPRASVNCKEVLTKNLECPSIGSFPVAGACDYFARCIQTVNGVESEVDFCPDGHIYVVNRCIRSLDINDCPQKMCAPLRPTTSTNAVKEQTTSNPTFPMTSPGHTNAETGKPKQKPTIIPLQNLHPSRNNSNSRTTPIKVSLFLLATLILINN